MREQPRPQYPVRVSIPGTRTDDTATCTLWITREAGGPRMIHNLDTGAVRLSEEQAARIATAILHLVSPGAAAAARAAASPHGEEKPRPAAG